MNRRDVEQLVNDFGDARNSPNHDFSHVYDDLHTIVQDSHSFNEYTQNMRAANQLLVTTGLIPELEVNGRLMPQFYIIGADENGHIMTADPTRGVLQLRDESMNILGEAKPRVNMGPQDNGNPPPADNGNPPTDNGNPPAATDNNPPPPPAREHNEDWKGEQVDVAADGSTTYTVRSGDTLSQIAQEGLRHRLHREPTHDEIWNLVDKIGKDNNIANVNLIYPNQKLRISFDGSAPPSDQQGQGNSSQQSDQPPGPGNGSIVAACSADVGKQMWTHYSGTNNGDLGCAAAVSEVLQSVGDSYANSAGCRVLEKQLEGNGWTQVSQPQPGDVVVGYRTNPDASTGGGAHTGIVGPDSTVYNNNSGSGTWVQSPLSYFSPGEFPSGVVYLRPPASAMA